MNSQIQEAAAVIRKIIAERPNILGSQLAQMLRQQLPDWNPKALGVDNLRHFIQMHLADVVVAQKRAGLDYVYETVVHEKVSHAANLVAGEADTDYWRVWVSPNSPVVLHISRDDLRIRVVVRGEGLLSREVLVEPASVDVHESMARQFAQDLGEDLKSKLLPVINSGDTRWWQVWVRELRAVKQVVAWNNFRRRYLEERLSERLLASGFNRPDVESLLAAVRENHLFASARKRAVMPEPTHGRDADAALRTIIIRIVQGMSGQQLRELRLPIGSVVDILGVPPASD